MEIEMARHGTLDIPVGVWTEITSNDVSGLTFFVVSQAVVVAATTGAAPENNRAGFKYLGGFGEINLGLAEFAPGIAATRVWVLAQYHESTVFVSHA
jgi:hypothetical protein